MTDKPIPKRPDGQYDKDEVYRRFMASPHIDWTRFAEDQGWDSHRTRPEFPVRTWQEEKKRRITEAQGDIILGLLHERKFTWTREILDTLSRYPKVIDTGLTIAEAKISQLGELYNEYVVWKKAGHHMVKMNNGRTKRVLHPFERVSGLEIASVARALREMTDAKLKALMLDKWAGTKLDLPQAELDPPIAEGGLPESRLTIEGKSSFTFDDVQKWFDEFVDKPSLPSVAEAKIVSQAASAEKQTSNEGAKSEPPPATTRHIPGVVILDDNGRPMEPQPAMVKRDDG